MAAMRSEMCVDYWAYACCDCWLVSDQYTVLSHTLLQMSCADSAVSNLMHDAGMETIRGRSLDCQFTVVPASMLMWV